MQIFLKDKKKAQAILCGLTSILTQYFGKFAFLNHIGFNSRVPNREKILTYIGALAKYGTRIGKPYVKHIDGEIWELRPLGNRIFFFYYKDNKFVLLHHFIKKTQKTPPKEIEKAKNNLKDFIERNDKA